jgi:hypothetical protein
MAARLGEAGGRGSALPPGQAYAGAQVRFSDAANGWLLGRVATSAAFSVGELLRTTDGGACPCPLVTFSPVDGEASERATASLPARLRNHPIFAR